MVTVIMTAAGRDLVRLVSAWCWTACPLDAQVEGLWRLAGEGLAGL
jgi:hypothetical protein